jgi:TetR/AcrR family transcriptional regulator, transcriptional repressor for nem operon
MAATKISRDDLLLKCWQVFHRQGFWFTTMDDLAKVCGLQKGSFYHHFSTKEALLRDVVQFAHRYFSEYVLAVADDLELPVEQRLEKFMRRQFRLTSIDNRGCFYGNLVLETSHTNPEFKTLYLQIFEDCMAALTKIFVEKHPPALARDLAEQTFLEYEGVAMMIKLSENQGFKENFIRRTLEKLNSKSTKISKIKTDKK